MEINSYFANRRTIRHYDQAVNISDSEIKEMLEVAARAANTGNMQLYSVIICTSKEEIAKLSPTHFNQPAITEAKAVLTFCIDLNRFNRWCDMNMAVPGMDNLQGFTWAAMDTAIFAQQFCTIAEMAGLGTCYLGTTTYNAPQISEILNLPSEVVPLITVTLGCPAESPEHQDRLPIDAIVHFSEYHNPSDDEIKKIYKEKEELEESKKFVKENKKENLAQVYSDIRYPKSSNEHFSKVYREFLKSKGIDI